MLLDESRKLEKGGNETCRDIYTRAMFSSSKANGISFQFFNARYTAVSYDN